MVSGVTRSYQKTLILPAAEMRPLICQGTYFGAFTLIETITESTKKPHVPTHVGLNHHSLDAKRDCFLLFNYLRHLSQMICYDIIGLTCEKALFLAIIFG